MAISLSKGERINLSKEAPGLKNAGIGLGWERYGGLMGRLCVGVWWGCVGVWAGRAMFSGLEDPHLSPLMHPFNSRIESTMLTMGWVWGRLWGGYLNF